MNKMTWEELFEQSTPEERQEILFRMLAYVEKRKELVDELFPFTDKTWGEFPWLLRKRLLAYTIFTDVKRKLEDTLPKHITLFNNLMLLLLGAFEYVRFEYLRCKKIGHEDTSEQNSEKTNSPAGRESEGQRGSGKR